jgi:spore coat polysaccharide biosynthesis protein SpsF
MKNIIFIQARLNSTRFPNKVLMKIQNKTMLEHVVHRLKLSKKADKLYILTSDNKNDDKIYNLSKKINVNIFRGAENDVLKRFYDAALTTDADNIIRVNGDNPLIDHRILDKMIIEFEKNKKIDYLSNILSQTFPVGMHIEIFTKHSLFEAHRKCKSFKRREHVTPYIYNNRKKFNCKNFSSKTNLSKHRWTVDYREDFEFVKSIYDNLYVKDKNFSTEKILNLLLKKPNLTKINYHIEKNFHTVS